jgi:hypothetical protein
VDRSSALPWLAKMVNSAGGSALCGVFDGAVNLAALMCLRATVRQGVSNPAGLLRACDTMQS